MDSYILTVSLQTRATDPDRAETENRTGFGGGLWRAAVICQPCNPRTMTP
jgi:hypothetical protein